MCPVTKSLLFQFVQLFICCLDEVAIPKLFFCLFWFVCFPKLFTRGIGSRKSLPASLLSLMRVRARVRAHIHPFIIYLSSAASGLGCGMLDLHPACGLQSSWAP